MQKMKQYELSHKIETIEELQSRISPYFSHEECFAHASKYLQWSINSVSFLFCFSSFILRHYLVVGKNECEPNLLFLKTLIP